MWMYIRFIHVKIDSFRDSIKTHPVHAIKGAYDYTDDTFAAFNDGLDNEIRSLHVQKMFL